jgi:hypothetical protein
MEFAGLPWDFERQKRGLGRPQTGSAVHHLVTSVSIKKALMGLLQSPAAADGEAAAAADGEAAVPASDASRTQSGKMRNRRLLSHCAEGIVKE